MTNVPPPPPAYSNQPGFAAEKKNGLGTTSLVLGIISIVAILTVIGGVVLGLIGVILGFIARGRVKRGEADNGGVAIAGIMTSMVGLLVSVLLIVIGVVFFADDFNNLTDCLEGAGDDDAAVEVCQREFEDNVVGG